MNRPGASALQDHYGGEDGNDDGGEQVNKVPQSPKRKHEVRGEGTAGGLSPHARGLGLGPVHTRHIELQY